MEDNREIVKWLGHMSLDGSFSTVSNMTLDKQQQQQVNEKQQIIETPNVRRDDNSKLDQLRNAIEETCAEDNVLSKEISELLNKLQINPQTLPVDVKESLKNMTAVLRAEGLSDVDETALIISMERKKVTNKKRNGIKRELKAKYKELLNRHSILERKLNYLMENITMIKSSIKEKETDYKNEYSSYKLMTSKLVEYNETASNIESDINNLNLKEFEPEKVLDKYRRLIEKKGKLAENNRALKPYRNLAPNLIQAKAMLESKELEYKKISEKFLGMNY